MKQHQDFTPSKGAYNAAHYPVMFEFRVPYQVHSNSDKISLRVNIEDVGRSFDYHFGNKSQAMLKEFTEALMTQITPDQVEKALKYVAHRALT